MDRTLGWLLAAVLTTLAPFTAMAGGLFLCVARGSDAHVAIEIGPCRNGARAGAGSEGQGPAVGTAHEACDPCVDIPLGTGEGRGTVRVVHASPAPPAAAAVGAVAPIRRDPAPPPPRVTPRPEGSPAAPLALRI